MVPTSAVDSAVSVSSAGSAASSSSSSSTTSSSSFTYADTGSLVQSLSCCYGISSNFPSFSSKIGSASTIDNQYIFVLGGLAANNIESIDLSSFAAISRLLPPESLQASLSIDIHYLNLIDRKWHSLSPADSSLEVPVPRFFHSITIVKYKIYLYGGISVLLPPSSSSSPNHRAASAADAPTAALTLLDDLWEFDLTHRRWRFLLNTNHRRYSSTLNVVHDTSKILPADFDRGLHAYHDSIVISSGIGAGQGANTNQILVYDLALGQLLAPPALKLPLESPNGNSSLVAFPFIKASSFNDTLFYFSNAHNKINMQTITAHNETFVESVSIPRDSCPVSIKSLKDIKGFMIGNSNLLVIGWSDYFLHTTLFNIPSRKWSALDNSCSVHPQNFHKITNAYLWKNHGKLVLLGSDTNDLRKSIGRQNSQVYHPSSDLVQDFDSIVVIDLSFSNILKFNGSKHGRSLIFEEDTNQKRRHFKSFKQAYCNEILSEAKLSLASVNDYVDNEKQLSPCDKLPNKTMPTTADIPRFKHSVDDERARFQKSIDFENYVNYLVPDSELKLNFNAFNIFDPSAVALGRNYFQRYLDLKNNSLTDFQIVSVDEEFCSVPLVLLLKRWGPFFSYMLAFAYLKTVQLLSKKIDKDIGCDSQVAHPAKKSFVSSVHPHTHAEKRYSISPSDGGKSTFDEDPFQDDIFKNFKSPLTFSLLSKMITGSPVAELSKSTENVHSQIKDSVCSEASIPSGNHTLNEARIHSLAHNANIIFNSPFENNKKITVSAGQYYSASPRQSEALNNFNDFIKLPSSRKNSIISNTSSFISNNSEPLPNHRSSSRSLLKKGSPVKERLASSPALGSDARRASVSGSVHMGSTIAIPEQLPLPDCPAPVLNISEATSPNPNPQSGRRVSSSSDPKSTSKHPTPSAKRNASPRTGEIPTFNINEGGYLGNFLLDDNRKSISSLGKDLPFHEVDIFVSTLEEYKKYHDENSYDNFNDFLAKQKNKADSSQTAQDKANEDNDTSTDIDCFKKHFLLEPLLIPRTLYLPIKSYTLKSLSEFFLTGQLSIKTAINPVLMELYSISKYYDIPLLFNICSEILYAIVGKKEHFIVSNLDFLEFELEDLIAKSEAQKEKILSSKEMGSTEPQAKAVESEIHELRQLKKELVEEFLEFRRLVKNVDYNGNFLLEILKSIAQYNIKLRRKHMRNAASRSARSKKSKETLSASDKDDLVNENKNQYGDTDDEEYESDELDEMTFGLAQGEFMYKKNRVEKPEDFNLKADLLKVEDINSSFESPPTDLIKLIFDYASLVGDSKLVLRSLYLLMTINFLHKSKKPIEAKIKDDLFKQYKEEEKILGIKKLQEEKQKQEKQLQYENQKKMEKYKLQELERIKVEKERMREEQRIKKQHHKMLKSKQQGLFNIERGADVGRSNSTGSKRLSPLTDYGNSLETRPNSLAKLKNSSRSSLASNASSLSQFLSSVDLNSKSQKCPLDSSFKHDKPKYNLKGNQLAQSLTSTTSDVQLLDAGTIGDDSLKNKDPSKANKNPGKNSIFKRHLYSKKSSSDISDPKNLEYYGFSADSARTTKQQNQQLKHVVNLNKLKNFTHHHQPPQTIKEKESGAYEGGANLSKRNTVQPLSALSNNSNHNKPSLKSSSDRSATSSVSNQSHSNGNSSSEEDANAGTDSELPPLVSRVQRSPISSSGLTTPSKQENNNSGSRMGPRGKSASNLFPSINRSNTFNFEQGFGGDANSLLSGTNGSTSQKDGKKDHKFKFFHRRQDQSKSESGAAQKQTKAKK